MCYANKNHFNQHVMNTHILSLGDYGDRALLVGDPGRAELIARKYLENSKPINTNRGLLAYGGTYRGRYVVVQTTGMGCPSTAIVMEELIVLGIQTFIRLGTSCRICGSNLELKNEKLWIASSAYGHSFTHNNYSSHYKENSEVTSNPSLLKKALKISNDNNIELGLTSIATVDNYYNNHIKADVKKWLKGGVGLIDMETSIIYDISKYYEKAAISVLLPSDYLISVNDNIEHQFQDLKIREYLTEKLITLGLEILV